MLKRLSIHAVLCVTWPFLSLLIVPFSWVAMNELFWCAGIEPALTERPITAIYHRMMGTMQEFEKHGDRIRYLQGHLHLFPIRQNANPGNLSMSRYSRSATGCG